MPNQTRNLLFNLLLIAALALPLAAEARSRAKTSPSVSLEVQTSSIMMRSLVRKHFTNSLNRLAKGQLVDTEGGRPYRLVVKFVGEGKSGSTPSRYQNPNLVLVEMTVDLVKGKGKPVWSWEGFAEQRSAERAVITIARELGNEMRRDGIVRKGRFTPKGDDED